MKVAAIQHDIVWEDPPANHERLSTQIKEAANDGAQLIALTEMYSWGFSMATERVHEAPDGPSVAFLVDQAERTGAWVCGSAPVLVEGLDKPHNRLLVASPHGDLHTYDKMYPFSYSGEHEHYTAGAAPLQVTIDDLRVSFFICYDLRFGNEFWNLADSTDLYVVVANWPAKRSAHWENLLMARAIENQAFVLGVNRVGDDGNGLHYSGDSHIIDPFGEVLAAATETEAILSADVTPGRVAEVRNRFPFLADRKA